MDRRGSNGSRRRLCARGRDTGIRRRAACRGAIRSEEDTPSGSLETPESSESAEEQESKPGLVILEEDNDDYRGAAGLKASDIDEKTSQLHAVTNGSGGSKTGGKTAAKAVKDYTVMVYIVGSNLESRLGAATTDIGEMKQAGIDFGKINLLVYTGGSRRWVSDILSTRAAAAAG